MSTLIDIALFCAGMVVGLMLGAFYMARQIRLRYPDAHAEINARMKDEVRAGRKLYPTEGP